MKVCWAILLAISFITAHDPNKENIQWTQYYRIGSVYSKTPTNGIAGYAGIKRTTENSFNDIRLFTHIFQIPAESQWNLKKRIGIVTGFTSDINDNGPNSSFSLTISFSDPINWKI